MPRMGARARMCTRSGVVGKIFHFHQSLHRMRYTQELLPLLKTAHCLTW